MRRVSALLAVSLLIGACTTSESGYARIERAVRNPDIAREVHSECTDIVSRQPRKTREKAAVMMDVSLTMVPSVYCRRVLNAVISGRLTRDDWNSMNNGEPTKNLIRVIKGRG